MMYDLLMAIDKCPFTWGDMIAMSVLTWASGLYFDAMFRLTDKIHKAANVAVASVADVAVGIWVIAKCWGAG